MRIPRSLFGRALALQGATLLLVAITLPLLLTLVLHRTADELVAASLRREATELTQQFTRTGIHPHMSQPHGRGYALFDTATGATIVAGGLAVHRAFVLRPPSQGIFTHSGSYDIFARHLVLHGRPTDLFVEQDKHDPAVIVDDVVRSVSWRFAALVGLIMLASLGASRLVLGRMLDSTRRVAQQASAIGPAEIGMRIDPNGLPSELQSLVDRVNDAFDRLAHALAAQRDFARHVAHELKTPLAILSVRARQVADPDLRGSLSDMIARADRVVEQLAELARLDCTLPDFHEVDLAEVVRTVMEQRAILAIEAGQSIAFDVRSDALMNGHAGLLATVAENLIGNAIHHNPPGTRICVTVGPGPRLEVTDDGNGPGTAVGDRFAQRSDGGGLGLVIVQRICTLHGGKVSVTAMSPYGTRALACFAAS